MREILFRGRRVDNGEWETGSLVYERKGTSEEQVSIADKMTAYHTPVIPETVGQYTGLCDRNGKKIFEGDILRLKDEKERYDWRAIVVFGNPNGEYSWGWQLQNITPNAYVNPDTLLWIETELDYVSCEVIGNIYDNPELMGGDTHG